jgi:NitT/TauT family transport system substrate-binding protein
MNKTLILVLVLLSLLAAACAAPQPEAQSTDLPAAPAGRGTIHTRVPADADVADVPWLMAIELLKDQGYTIEPVPVASDIAADAYAQGDLDISALSNQRAWAAVGQGAPLMTIMEWSANTFMLITPKEIKTCADLDGKPVASNGVATVAGALLDAYLEKNCPDAEPEILAVRGGSNRTAALLSGEVDAAIQDIDDLVQLELDRPGEFHPLILFAEENSGVQISGLAVHREFAEQNPEAVKDVIRAVFAARRSVQDPDVLREAIIERVEMEPESAQQAADTYLEQKVWDVSGTVFTPETVQTNLEFLQEYGDVPADLTLEDVADLSYYDAVVEEMGLQE